jgi:hypothetical protein
MDNYVKKYIGAEHMWPTARAYRKDVHDHMAQVYCIPDVKLYLDTYHSLKWYRSEFSPVIKCDYVTNNIAEVFKNWIKDIKDLPVCELADKLREKLMTLWHNRRRIEQRLDGRILPAVLYVLKAQTRGLGHLNVVHDDHYAAQVADITRCNARHVVKAYLHECSCEEWQQTCKPCQHDLALITAQPIRDVRLQDFVDEYYYVERFRNAYKRLIEPFPNKTQLSKVNISSFIGVPLGKRSVGRQKKNRFKGALEGGGGRKKPSDKEKKPEKENKVYRGKIKCSKCGELGHRQSSYK